MAENKKTKKADPGDRCLYRVLGYQPLSVEMEAQTLEGLSIQNLDCNISIQSAECESASQRKSGGSILGIEFEAESDQDLIVTSRQGLSLLEDFLSAISLVNGSTFQATEPVEVTRHREGDAAMSEFLIFKRLPLKHWSKPINRDTVKKAKHLLAHWDGLDSGHRLRRAALRYRQAIGNLDDTAAFQDAYIGLESMEPPLAKAVGLQPGTEEVKGACKYCGHEFTRKKTTLVGVRTFVLDSPDLASAEKSRKDDWKLLNKLRNELMHGLADPEKLSDRPHKALLASMHHLHASICLMSHAGDLVTNEFQLARGGPTYLLFGRHKSTSLTPLHKWQGSLTVNNFDWVLHEQYGLVPQLDFKNDGLKELEMSVGQLGEPYSYATMDSLQPTRIERD